MKKSEKKPICKMVGQNGNVFNLMGLANRAMKNAGKEAEGKTMLARVMKSGSYGEALRIMGEYVDIR
jgi:hypothetical protein